jgi:hypothetical protein
VGKVDELHDAVNHGVAQRDQGVDTAEDEAVNELLEEDVHGAAIAEVKKMAPRWVPFLLFGYCLAADSFDSFPFPVFYFID